MPGREQLINAVKAEVEQVHEIGARSKADLAHVAEHRGEVTALKNQVDLLLSRIADTDERIAGIDARRKLVDEVQAKTNAIVHVLDDVRINLETLGEQKARRRSRRGKGRAARIHAAGSAEHAAHAPARTRAGRAHRAGHQAVAIDAPACRKKEANGVKQLSAISCQLLHQAC